MWYRLSTSILTLFMISALVGAQSGYDDQGNINDPNENERANACYEGGTLEGKCDSQLIWDAGWFLIRFESGLLSREEIPFWASWVLPVLPPEESVSEESVSEEFPIQTTCTIEFLGGSFSHSNFGASVDVSLNTVNGIDAGGVPGVYWATTRLYYGNGSAGSFLWSGSWSAGEIATTNCPTPTPF